MKFISGTDVRQALPMPAAIDAMRVAFAHLSDGTATVPVRLNLPTDPDGSCLLAMPAYVPREAWAAKLVTITHKNPARGLPLIHALVCVFDPDTGQPLALIDGEALTVLRTAAASGLATALLARPDAAVVSVIGAGAQAGAQLEAVCAVRPIKQVYITSRTPERARKLAEQLHLHVDINIAYVDAFTAVREADVLCTATTATTPVLQDADLKPGVHINAIGGYRADMVEIPAATVCRAKVVVDQRAAALAEAGDLVQPIRQGLITEAHLHAELGEIVLGRKTGRTSASEITLFKSVGNAVQDAVAAQAVLAAAARLNLGTTVPWE